MTINDKVLYMFKASITAVLMLTTSLSVSASGDELNSLVYKSSAIAKNQKNSNNSGSGTLVIKGSNGKCLSYKRVISMKKDLSYGNSKITKYGPDRYLIETTIPC